jgi:hypothetical protein|tara:strand:- start:371 stop:499 length:129 start_codon:yes stop_codon:yes gene_type:complete
MAVTCDLLSFIIEGKVKAAEVQRKTILEVAVFTFHMIISKLG